MDTAKYDQEMEKLRNVERKKTAGRPKGPDKVVFKKRVTREQFKQLAEFVDAVGQLKDASPIKSSDPLGFPSAGLPANALQSLLEERGRQIQALLDDVEKLTKERDELLLKRENWTRATESQKVAFWVQKHDQLKLKYEELKFRMDGLDK